MFARIIHLADTIDIIGNNTGSGNNSWNFICQYLLKKRDVLFDSECVNAFFHAFPHSESFICLSDNSFEMKLWEIIPRQKQVFDWKTCKNVADFFAKIVDYKSSFTSRHSIGVAEKAAFFAQYIGYDSINVQKIYLAGALHDIGKMAVGNEILEKPDKLTDDEFSKMKNHAGYTYLILSEVQIIRSLMQSQLCIRVSLSRRLGHFRWQIFYTLAKVRTESLHYLVSKP